jgi:uncharacterized protein (TIGR02001 family)
MSAAGAAVLCAGAAAAQDSPWTITGTVGLTSNYMFRGISQTFNDPALFGSATFAHSSGFYAGFWGSSIDFGDDADFELDGFIGYGGALGETTTFDVNITYYGYPAAPDGTDYDYVELIGGITQSLGDSAKIGIKAAYSPDFFGGIGDAFWLGGTGSVVFTDWLSASANIGYQWFDDAGVTDYMHYDIGLTATVENISFDIRYIGTDLDFVDEEVVGTITFAF